MEATKNYCRQICIKCFAEVRQWGGGVTDVKPFGHSLDGKTSYYKWHECQDDVAHSPTIEAPAGHLLGYK